MNKSIHFTLCFNNSILIYIYIFKVCVFKMYTMLIFLFLYVSFSYLEKNIASVEESFGEKRQKLMKI
jgi:hypothetical protein